MTYSSRVQTGRAWVVLALSFCVNLSIQLLWISYAPVNEAAQAYYGVGDTAISWFAMTFMVAFLPLSLPASLVVDRYGTRAAVGGGALLAGIGGVLRGAAGPNFALAMAATVLIAAAQPFLLNAWAATAQAWFAPNRRAGAISVITVGNLLGTALGMTIPPILPSAVPIGTGQLWFGLVMLATGIAYAAFARSHPAGVPTVNGPDAPGEPHRPDHPHVLAGTRHALGKPPFVLMCAVVFLGLGVFNGLTTWVEPLLRPRGLTSADAGLFGAAMLVAGLVGAVVAGAWADRTARRVPIVTVCAVGAAVGLLMLTFLPGRAATFVAGAVLGFWLTGLVPVVIEYTAEVALPTPEGTSNGVVQLIGQSSVAVVAVMGATRTADGSFTPSLIGLAVALGALALVVRRLPEPARARASAESARRGRGEERTVVGDERREQHRDE